MQEAKARLLELQRQHAMEVSEVTAPEAEVVEAAAPANGADEANKVPAPPAASGKKRIRRKKTRKLSEEEPVASEPVKENLDDEPGQENLETVTEEARAKLRASASAAAGGPSTDRPLVPDHGYDASKEDAQDPKWFERTASRKIATPCRAPLQKAGPAEEPSPNESSTRKSLHLDFEAAASSCQLAKPTPGMLAIMPATSFEDTLVDEAAEPTSRSEAKGSKDANPVRESSEILNDAEEYSPATLAFILQAQMDEEDDDDDDVDPALVTDAAWLMWCARECWNCPSNCNHEAYMALLDAT